MRKLEVRLTGWVIALGLIAIGSLGGATVLAQQIDMGKPVSPAVQKANIEIKNVFMAAHVTRDYDKALTTLADNVMYRVTQRNPWTMARVGKEPVAGSVRGGSDYRVLRSVSVGPVVLDERDDVFLARPAAEATATTPARPAVAARAIRVHAGFFVVLDGKITEWADYRMTDPVDAVFTPGMKPGELDYGAMVTPEMQKANVAIVNDFNASFKKKDLAKIASLLDDNVVYRVTHTRPLTDARVGKEAVTTGIKALMSRGDIDFKVVPGSTVTMGPVVAHERDDYLPGANGAPGRWIRVHAGVFVVDKGKIVEWTDYRLE